jgi:predicted enzyme related to lactoylglutathione lyase
MTIGSKRMSDAETGSITWLDLTVENAEEIRDFYARVVGWEVASVEMAGYSDFCMNAPGSGKTMAGICHARGVNADLPPQWLAYITVEDAADGAKRCEELGGKILAGPKSMGGQGSYCVIQDPAGAVVALFSPERK